MFRSFPPSHQQNGQVVCTEVAGGTRLQWTTSFEVRIPLIGEAIGRWIAQPFMQRMFERIVDRAERDLVSTR
ncbi:SRPBCC family protein [Mycobacteroides immunogenum]|uniref:hypothetical protein n=1 Tax=Mycobacteroides immunogenum TaxID=83262 RepID=UPI000695C9D9|nr:hypothetical protein [Mycobacteroides immunogenum]ANO06530.1 hypothetical protein BAB75_27245 [Mycobacteroides immunogenum]MCV7307828.1 hypothetical protein [Mycobacteroides immunogenum]ORV77110.1 hypothetical protein AWC10_18345 [Mycobacteroides immunogenum]